MVYSAGSVYSEADEEDVHRKPIMKQLIIYLRQWLNDCRQ